MSENKHTPPPWYWHIDDAINGFGEEYKRAWLGTEKDVILSSWAAHSTSNGLTICGIDDIDDSQEFQDHPNAQLIAAAPDLLEACRLALQGLPNYAKAWDELTSAIAKAEGTDA